MACRQRADVDGSVMQAIMQPLLLPLREMAQLQPQLQVLTILFLQSSKVDLLCACVHHI